MNKKKLVITVALVCVVLLEAIAVFVVSDRIDSGSSGEISYGEINDGFCYFGEYPQTLKEGNVIVGDTADYRGYYYGSDGAYYAKVVATPYADSYTFSNGAGVVKGETYYFKVEPIRWRVVEKNGSEVTLICDGIIANQAFDGYNDGEYSNNYAESDVRAWLNGTFLNEAFSDIEQKKILDTMVDNSAASTGAATNDFACEDTLDKLYLPSFAELFNHSSVFAGSPMQMMTSDYSRATGAYMNTYNHYGYGWWWTRSPYVYGGRDAYQVSYDGNGGAYVSSVRGDSRGIVPVLRARLD